MSSNSISVSSKSSDVASDYKNNADYWIQKDKQDHIKTLYKTYNSFFPKIKKDCGFQALANVSNLSFIPWPLYVMALTKMLNPDSKPAFRDMPVDDLECRDLSPSWEMSLGHDMSKCRIACDICNIAFLPLAKDDKGISIIHDVDGLYKLHKSTHHLDSYPVCSACFYALQNPAVMLDYPKNNRENDIGEDDYTWSFLKLKRSSNFNYLGVFTPCGNDGSYVPADSAVDDLDDGQGKVWLNITDFAN
jgi:hypothetical protein